VVRQYRIDLPSWIRNDRPRCIQALGLTLPCTTDEVLSAYRTKVKSVHPDRGGDGREFLLLQEHFEQAMSLAEKV
jgi:curved DNA-binding protein CbpA